MRTVTDIFGLSAVGGLHLPAARLWLDGKPRGALAFVPDLQRRSPTPGRMLCSARLLQLWGDLPTLPLAPPFRERFRLGELHMELLPNGATPGGAMLAVEGKERDLLIATSARLERLPHTEPLPAYDADVLVVDATLAGVQHAGMADVQLAVDDTIAELSDGLRGAVWLFDDLVMALCIASFVGHRAPIFANLGLKRLHWRYQDASLAVPRIRRLGQRAPAGAFVLWPASRAEELQDRDTDDFVFTLAAESADLAAADQVGAERALPLSRRAAGTELDRLIAALQPADVVALGAGAGALAARHGAANGRQNPDSPRFWHLTADRQLPLFQRSSAP